MSTVFLTEMCCFLSLLILWPVTFILRLLGVQLDKMMNLEGSNDTIPEFISWMNKQILRDWECVFKLNPFVWDTHLSSISSSSGSLSPFLTRVKESEATVLTRKTSLLGMCSNYPWVASIQINMLPPVLDHPSSSLWFVNWLEAAIVEGVLVSPLTQGKSHSMTPMSSYRSINNIEAAVSRCRFLVFLTRNL